MRKLTEKFTTFEDVYEKLCDMVELKRITPFVEIATVAAAVVTSDDEVFYGVNIKADCGMGFCAERNAMSSMLTLSKTKIKYILCVDRTKNLRLPCGACREFIAQINPENMETEILESVKPKKSVKLKKLLPSWWGHEKMNRK